MLKANLKVNICETLVQAILSGRQDDFFQFVLGVSFSYVFVKIERFSFENWF